VAQDHFSFYKEKVFYPKKKTSMRCQDSCPMLSEIFMGLWRSGSAPALQETFWKKVSSKISKRFQNSRRSRVQIPPSPMSPFSETQHTEEKGFTPKTEKSLSKR
jgi:hypothetical protein